MSESVEEYLEAIYHFNEKGELANNNEIAERLHVAPPSVIQMIKRLAEKVFVELESRKSGEAPLTALAISFSELF